MNPVHVLASEPHYVDHLAPIWHALDPEERGRFYATSLSAHARAQAHRIENLHALQRHFPSTAAAKGWWMVAGWPDLRKLGKNRTAVLLEHGAGQHYAGQPSAATDPHYAGGAGRDRVGLFLCPNQATADRSSGAWPRAVIEVVGCPYLDPWVGKLPAASPDEAPAVAFSFRWQDGRTVAEQGSARGYYRHEIERLAGHVGALPWTMIGHAHPRNRAALHTWWASLGVPFAQEWEAVLTLATVYVCDNSSTLFEFAALGRPVVVLDSPAYRRTITHGLRFWRWADIGPRVGAPGELAHAIDEALDGWYHGDPYAEVRRAMAEEVYPHLGSATARAVKALRAHLP